MKILQFSSFETSFFDKNYFLSLFILIIFYNIQEIMINYSKCYFANQPTLQS